MAPVWKSRWLACLALIVLGVGVAVSLVARRPSVEALVEQAKQARAAKDLIVPYMKTSEMGKFSDIQTTQPQLGSSIVEVMIGYHAKADATRQGVEEFLKHSGFGSVKVSMSAIPART